MLKLIELAIKVLDEFINLNSMCQCLVVALCRHVVVIIASVAMVCNRTFKGSCRTVFNVFSDLSIVSFLASSHQVSIRGESIRNKRCCTGLRTSDIYIFTITFKILMH